MIGFILVSYKILLHDLIVSTYISIIVVVFLSFLANLGPTLFMIYELVTPPHIIMLKYQ